jgi:glycerol-3-phosphate dehydrogenase
VLELSARTRRDHLERMAQDELDVLVVGGGITGAGVALDAASRGLSVGLVERDDFAAGTSGRSSRLVHGGARYLQHAEFRLVYEALRERNLLWKLAPHLVRPLGFLIPTRRPVNRAYVGFGLTLYDTATLGRTVLPHRRVGRAEVLRLAPTLSRPSGGHLSFDCRTDDARLTLEVVRTAASHGALVANHASVEALPGQGRVCSATVVDRLDGGRMEIRARMVVNATGAWAGAVQGLATSEPTRLRPSKGVHVVFERRRLPIRCAVMVPSIARDGSLVFAVPWGPRVYAGTTDTPYDGDLDAVAAEPRDVAVVTGSLARAFEGELGPDDVVASWAGIRPLLDAAGSSTRDLSRRHLVTEDPPGLTTVTGGKLTTYRAMAQDVVDRVCRELGRGASCRTGTIPLGLTRPLDEERHRAERDAGSVGLPPSAGRRLVDRYGDDWETAVAMIRGDPSLGDEAVPGLPVLRVELEMAELREMAVEPEDVMVRRTRLATMDDRLAAATPGKA